MYALCAVFSTRYPFDKPLCAGSTCTQFVTHLTDDSSDTFSFCALFALIDGGFFDIECES